MSKPDLKPDDDCACGSGRRYGDCHGPIFAAPRGKAVEVAQEIYAREWGVNADHYVTEGLYAALAAELVEAGDVVRVLDIGCGLGQGLEALSAAIPQRDRLIAGIDENPHCLADAATRLELAPEAVASARLQWKLGMKRYDTVPAPAAIVVQGDRVLINADVLVKDVAFQLWLRDNGPFDAVTLWFTGGHKARSMTKVAQRISARGDEDFRWAIEDEAMKIALRHLRPGGLIQIVVRGAGDIDGHRREVEADRRRAIAGSPIELVAVRAYPYVEPVSPGAIVMRGSGGTHIPGQQMAISTLLRARELSTEAATGGLFAVVNRTPFNIAPERAQVLAGEVFGTGEWTITPLGSKAEFWARVDQKSVYVTWAGLASLWCVAYVAYSVMQMGSLSSRAPEAKSVTGVDFANQWHDLNLQGYVDYAKRLVREDRSWPPGLGVPDAQASPTSHEGKINNLFFGALSWILLHEIGHVHHGHDPFLPADQMVRQEIQADDFATSWVLDDAGSGLDREFRALMVITALAWLFLFESVGGQGPTHPPVIQRFRAATAKFDLGERSPALENGSYLLKALFDPAGSPPSKRPTPRQAFDWMAQRLEILFPVR
ncbi:phage exclusion protein Lit family protein [Sphingomonas sp. LHG3406-1]|uniref:phage exclusion protein Lit family protein n=1 Tax=Sphingomonas sp. LHG3406-1 TaxID=2804617 RepID=UPI0026226CFD|nr:phage exclusion protein Lit family protein [Sphingomonas sp. LHG3406-1]